MAKLNGPRGSKCMANRTVSTHKCPSKVKRCAQFMKRG